MLEECLNYTNLVKGIRVQRSDLVGLIMRRNELANNILKASTAQLLPPMLQVRSFLNMVLYISIESLKVNILIFCYRIQMCAKDAAILMFAPFIIRYVDVGSECSYRDYRVNCCFTPMLFTCNCMLWVFL